MPAFHPSRPLESAQSLQEGLLLCDEYHVPPQADRPAALRPFMNCLDRLSELHPPQSADGVTADFEAFRQELHLNYGGADEHVWNAQANQEIDAAVHAILRALWREGSGTREVRPVYTPIERDRVLARFPITARRLSARDWPVSEQAAMDPKLEGLKSGLAALANGAGEREASSGPPASSPANVKLCRRLFKLRSESDYLSALRQDQLDLAKIEPGSPILKGLQNRYSARLDAALHELDDLRPKIAEARTQSGFRVLACSP